MANLTQSVTGPATNHQRAVVPDPVQRPHAAASIVVNGPLRLSGGVPQTVLIEVSNTQAGMQVLLSLPGQNEQYTQGIVWNPAGYALMITFQFLPGAVQIQQLLPITPSLWFSDTVNGASQVCCVMPVLGTYEFGVNVPPTDGGTVHRTLDPKIVVTPINNPGTPGTGAYPA